MKNHILTIICIVILSGAAQAQEFKNSVSLSSGTFIPFNGYFPKIKYERNLNNNFSVGVITKIYLDAETTTGISEDIFLRYYFGEETMNGFYLQFAGVLGKVNYTTLYQAEPPTVDNGINMYELLGEYSWIWLPFDLLLSDESNFVYTEEQHKLMIYGTTYHAGFHKKLNNEHLYLDVNIGAKFIKKHQEIKSVIYKDELIFTHIQSSDNKEAPEGFKYFENTNAGNIFSGVIAIGYKF